MLPILRLIMLVCGVLALVCQSPVVDAACASRTRKSFDRLTATERDTYVRALQLAMDRGYYIKFVEMHMEKMSEMEAHRMCMFTYWHRYFLLGFENMLRSLGPEFQCVTIPYWDEIQHNARAMSGSCSSIESCSPIVAGLGGTSSGTVKGVTINGAYVSGGRCVNRPPLNKFCESSSKTGSACARCLPRNSFQQKYFPPETNFASVYRQLFTAGNFVQTGKSLEEGMHNTFHSVLGSTMSTMQSPADPLFWSHHAYVDLLFTIYLKCRVGLGQLSDAQKQNNPYTFVQCPRRDNTGFFTTSSTVTMRNGEKGVNPKQASQPGQVLYPFFSNLPARFYQLSDILRLTTGNSYTYSVSGLVAQMATQCDSATGSRRLEEEVQPKNKNRHLKDCKSDLESGEAEQNKPHPGPFVVDHTDDNDESGGKVRAWVDDAREQLRATSNATDYDHTGEVLELEKMVCVFYDQCRGGVQDYSEEFKKAFNVTGPPPCKRIVDELKANGIPVCAQMKLTDWRDTMEKYFPCELPGDAYTTKS
ncbi:hypothetical protein Poli38472_000882 [Pythium oligandrum]|uniref:Tyrosinase copper-binding domain-containing protein n=1 Tax=Pythium oligandrum TaxID=41045 RepID=A0A8K1FER6_PYTOL|nr:hypothetical protein Poli38472_000882 [Pythium oligandrum]|eukprot:TMW60840.1 hypothetical protein Poli38472_000882 [Pythium oligandrum]